MASIFDSIPGAKGRPVRREAQLKVTRDEEGNLVMEPVDMEAIVLSPEGAVDRYVVRPQRFHGCGCPAEMPIGSKCGEPGCGRISCERCSARCQACLKPLCPQHVARLALAGQAMAFCSRCLAKHLRRRRLRAVARLVLHPFVNFDRLVDP
jgi:hypothetical protein